MDKRNDWFFDNWEKDFDKSAKRITGLVVTLWLLSAIASLAFWVVVVWGIIELVQWVQTK